LTHFSQFLVVVLSNLNKLWSSDFVPTIQLTTQSCFAISFYLEIYTFCYTADMYSQLKAILVFRSSQLKAILVFLFCLPISSTWNKSLYFSQTVLLTSAVFRSSYFLLCSF